jgi:hypothetical protein
MHSNRDGANPRSDVISAAGGRQYLEMNLAVNTEAASI